MGLRKLPDLTEREKALSKAKDSSKRKKDAAARKKKATGNAVYEKYVNQYQREEDRTGINKKADKFFDKVGDKVRGSAVGKYAKSKGTGTFSRDDEAQMQARKDIKGYKKGGKVLPKKRTKEEQARFEKEAMAQKNKAMAPKPVQGAGNMPLDDKQAAQQVKFLKSKNKEKEMKGMKKMNMGGMTAPSGMDAAAMMAMKKKKRKPMMPAQQAMDGGAAMPMMKKGGKVRGAGMAKKGVRACKMR